MNILFLSYGKDSTASIFVCKKLGIRIDKIVTVDIMFNEKIKYELPEVEEYKYYADKKIKELFGYEVEHIKSDKTFIDMFFKVKKFGKHAGNIYGFPSLFGCHVLDRLKLKPIKDYMNDDDVSILGIACDEEKRLERYKSEKFILPLLEGNVTEKDCYNICKTTNLLSPIYTSEESRSGCWFCRLQKVTQLKYLYDNYRDYYQILVDLEKLNPYGYFKGNKSLVERAEIFEESNKNREKGNGYMDNKELEEKKKLFMNKELN